MDTPPDSVFGGPHNGDSTRPAAPPGPCGAPVLLAILTFLVSACGPPSEARIDASERLEGMPPPALEPTASFGSALEGASPDAEDLLAEAEALRARAEALRARAQALSAEAAVEAQP